MSDYCYTYAAALYCEPCGEKLRAELSLPEGADPDDETSFDSDDYPTGPYEMSEADFPFYCDGCGEFLENPLTAEGVQYVRNAIETVLRVGDPDNRSVAVTVWRGFYGIEPEDARSIRLGRMAPNVRKLAYEKDGTLPKYADGGYPLYYVAGIDTGAVIVCHDCANDHKTGLDAFDCAKIDAYDVNYETPEFYCKCGARIESAYAEDEVSKAASDEG